MQEPQRYTQVRRRIVAVQPLDGGVGLINIHSAALLNR